MEKLEKMNKISLQNKRHNTVVIKHNKGSTGSSKNSSSKGISGLTLDSTKSGKETTKVDDAANLSEYREQIESMFKRLNGIFPQFDMNGDKNIWIMKPSGLSRGRGIACISNLNELLTFIKKNSSQYIIQKYIENPLIIMDRKVSKNF